MLPVKLTGQRHDKQSYCAINTALPAGAPLRTVTVGDAIGDLPLIDNGHSR